MNKSVITKQKVSLVLLLFSFSICKNNAQNSSKDLFNQLYSINLSDKKSDRFAEIAKFFINKPYVAGTLEGPTSETLVVNLHQFDCTTLVETSLALALCKPNDFDDFKKKLTQIRYRNGEIVNYASRLHYLTDWLQTNQTNGILELETKKMGGILFKNSPNFMSTHWPLYPRANSDLIKSGIIVAEKELAKQTFYFIPKSNIPSIESKIKEGDIIAITTSIAGLDCSHQGIAVWKEGNLHLLHASSSHKKVIISALPLKAYINQIKSHSGIMIGRIL
ncbi:MAG: N-acetylmuramoyl-L-alanine amidase-like domain-containing protein [Bacteroidota bacterium]